MAMKSLLVHLGGTERDTDVLNAALMAAEGGGHLDCVYVRPDPATVGVAAGDIVLGIAPVITEAIHRVEQAGRAGADRSNEVYRIFLRTHDVVEMARPEALHHATAHYSERTGDAALRLIEEALTHDLTVLAGESQGKPGFAAEDAGAILIETGRPVLLAPEHYSPRPFRTIAIAWKDRPEAARAVTAAMPFLMRGERVLVLGAHERGEREDLARSLDAVTTQLRWHGLKPESRVILPGDDAVPDAVLRQARRDGADLLVMGAYGHSRLRELIFGGFTERVLKGVDFPVFAAH
jgi:nucleotide-binding universal stress UspA family protein